MKNVTLIVIPFHKIIDTNSLPCLPCPPCLPVRQVYQTYGETVLVVVHQIDFDRLLDPRLFKKVGDLSPCNPSD
jgi:hypothetical protein